MTKWRAWIVKLWWRVLGYTKRLPVRGSPLLKTRIENRTAIFSQRKSTLLSVTLFSIPTVISRKSSGRSVSTVKWTPILGELKFYARTKCHLSYYLFDKPRKSVSYEYFIMWDGTLVLCKMRCFFLQTRHNLSPRIERRTWTCIWETGRIGGRQ